MHADHVGAAWIRTLDCPFGSQKSTKGAFALYLGKFSSQRAGVTHLKKDRHCPQRDKKQIDRDF